MSCRMKYAFFGDTIYHIDEVPPGLMCGCVCPACKRPVVAKNQGLVRGHHFSHYQSEDCEHCNETQLHLTAKALIEKSDTITLPEITYPYDQKYHRSSWQENIFNVELEKRVDSIIPDVLVTTSSYGKYIIEICVTHAVDENKRNKIHQLGISAIEVDLSDFDQTKPDEDQLEEALRNPLRMTWIYNHEVEERERQEAYWNAYHNGICPFCGSKLVRKHGISRNGYSYDVIKCSDQRCGFWRWTDVEKKKHA